MEMEAECGMQNAQPINTALPEAVGVTLTKMIDAFKERVSAAYILGSFARHMPSNVSDIDFAVILTHPVSEADEKKMNMIVTDVQKMDLPYAARLSVFWGSVESLNTTSAIGRFPPLDRLDLIENSRLLHGNDIRKKLIRPTRRELIIAGAEFALEKLSEGKVNEALMQPELFFPRLDDVHLTKIILMPVRLLYTALTGNIGYNDASVAYYTRHFPGSSAELVSAAFRWRTESPKNKTETIALLLQHNALHTLYQQFMECYITQLQQLGAPSKLVEHMVQWRSKWAGNRSGLVV